MIENHFCIIMSDGSRLHVENDAGPLTGVDVEADPADGAAALWRAIEAHDPIYVTQNRNSDHSRVWYPNLAHVAAIVEITKY